jgi:diaminopimelate decarboxylase
VRQEGADQPARQSERRPEDPSVHFDRSQGSQVRRCLRHALTLYRRAAALPNIEIAGIDCHIGSQLLDPSPFVEALDRILALVDQLASEGIHIHHLDLGGGLGIKYNAEQVQPTVASYLTPLLDKLAGRGLQVVLEPGRRLVGNAGLLLTKIEYLKEGEGKNFAIIDAAMNDLMRPALYEAWHDIDPVVPRTVRPANTTWSARSAKPATSSARPVRSASSRATCWP